MIIQTQRYVSVGKLHYEMVQMLCKAEIANKQVKSQLKVNLTLFFGQHRTRGR